MGQVIKMPSHRDKLRIAENKRIDALLKFGEAIERERVIKGLTKPQLARRAQITMASYHAVINATLGTPILTYVRILEALGRLGWLERLQTK